MRGDDMILISVDDHIAEPADMFDAHVPAKYRDHAPRVVTDERGVQQWWYGDGQGPQPRAQRGRGQAARDVQRRPVALRRDASRVLRRARARPRHVGRRSTRGAQLPELDGLLGPGAEPGARSRRQPRDDPGVQRLARRRVVRRVSRALHPVRHPPAVRRRARRSEVQRLAAKGCHAVTFSENPEALNMPSIHSRTLGSAVRRVRRRGHRAVLPRRLVVAGVDHDQRRARQRADDALVDHAHLHAGRPDVGRLLVALPRPRASR